MDKDGDKQGEAVAIIAKGVKPRAASAEATVTEINDDDYRSFSMPCYALDEPEEGDCGD